MPWLSAAAYIGVKREGRVLRGFGECRPERGSEKRGEEVAG